MQTSLPSRGKNIQAILPVALFFAILAVSTASILIRLAQREAPSITIAAMRLTLATILLTPFTAARYQKELKTIKKRELLLAAASGGFLALHFGTWISSLQYTTVASSVVFVSTGPLWVALLSPVLLGERLTRGTKFGLTLAVLGAIVIGTADACTWRGQLQCGNLNPNAHGRALWGDFLALIGAWAVSGYLVIGRRLRQILPLLPYVVLVYSCAAILLVITMIARGETLLGFQPITYVWLLLLAIVPQIIGHSTYNWALAYLPATFVAVTTLGEPIGSAILAYIILNEHPGPFVILGAILILSGIYLTARTIPEART